MVKAMKIILVGMLVLGFMMPLAAAFADDSNTAINYADVDQRQHSNVYNSPSTWDGWHPHIDADVNVKQNQVSVIDQTNCIIDYGGLAVQIC